MIQRKPNTGIKRKHGVKMKRTKLKHISKVKKRASKAPSLSKMMKRCDTLFSLKVRQYRAELDGTQTCYTCGHKSHWKKMHAGHFLSRYYKSARWDEDNVKPQCFICNIYKKGDAVKFRQHLIEEIGEARVLAVEAKRNVSIKLTREYLNDLITSLQ